MLLSRTICCRLIQILCLCGGLFRYMRVNTYLWVKICRYTVEQHKTSVWWKIRICITAVSFVYTGQEPLLLVTPLSSSPCFSPLSTVKWRQKKQQLKQVWFFLFFFRSLNDHHVSVADWLGSGSIPPTIFLCQILWFYGFQNQLSSP